MGFNYTLLVNYLLCLGFGLLVWVVFLRNFLVAWLKVRLPFVANADILTRVKNPIGDYFATGSYNGGFLTYKPKSRPDNPDPKRMIPIPLEVYNRAVYRAFGVPCIDVDDVKNCILVWQGGSEGEEFKNYTAVEGFNAEALAEGMDTALNKPSKEDKEKGLKNNIFQFVVIGLIIIVGVMAYMALKKVGVVDAHLKTIYDLVRPMYINMNLTAAPPMI